jgi:hypothetical protein
MSFYFYWALWIWLLKTVHGTSLLLLGLCAVQAFTSSLPSLDFFLSRTTTVSHWLANNSSSCLHFPVRGFPFLTQLIFLFQRWWKLVPIKLCHVSTKLHGITFQNVIICMHRISFTLSKCNTLAHCFHNTKKKFKAMMSFSVAVFGQTQSRLLNMFSPVLWIFLMILLWYTNSILFTHVVSCNQFVSKGTLHEDQSLRYHSRDFHENSYLAH